MKQKPIVSYLFFFRLGLANLHLLEVVHGFFDFSSSKMAFGALEAEGDVEWSDQNGRSKDMDTLLRLPTGCSSFCEHQGLGGFVDGGEELRDLLCLWVALMAGIEGLQILLGLGKVS